MIHQPLRLGDTPIDGETVARVSRGDAPVELTPAARERVRAARQVVERLAATGEPIYGLTTGLGAAVDTPLPQEDLIAFQTRAVHARGVAVGPTLSRELVRAAMFVRAAGMATGGSGVSPAVLDGLIALLNAGIHPLVPRLGSIGAADLAPPAHLALPLIGPGEVEYRGSVMPAMNPLAQPGLAPVPVRATAG